MRFLKDVVAAFPAQDLHMVLDNLNVHNNEAARHWLQRHPGVHFHCTPTHASWVNLVECFFSILGKQSLAQSVHASKRQGEEFLLDLLARNNENPRPFLWTKRGKSFSPSSRRLNHTKQRTPANQGNATARGSNNKRN